MSAGWPGSTGLTAPSLTPTFHSKKELLGFCPPGSPGQWTEWALSASLAARQAWKELLMAEMGQASPSSSIIQGLSCLSQAGPAVGLAQGLRQAGLGLQALISQRRG